MFNLLRFIHFMLCSCSSLIPDATKKKTLGLILPILTDVIGCSRISTSEADIKAGNFLYMFGLKY